MIMLRRPTETSAHDIHENRREKDFLRRYHAYQDAWFLQQHASHIQVTDLVIMCIHCRVADESARTIMMPIAVANGYSLHDLARNCSNAKAAVPVLSDWAACGYHSVRQITIVIR